MNTHSTNINSIFKNSLTLFFVFQTIGLICGLLSNFTLFLLFFLLTAFIIIKYNDIKALILFVFCTFFQNIFYSVSLTSYENQLLVIIKELIVYITAFIYFIKYKCIGKNASRLDNLIFIFLYIILFINIIRPGAPIGLKITALRQICIPSICYYFGLSLKLNKTELKAFFSIYSILTISLCIMGLIIYILPDSFWFDINYDIFYYSKHSIHLIGSTENFYSWDIGEKMKRFVSITADPIATAHLIGFFLIYLYISNIYPKKQGLILTSFCALLCFSKSLILLFIIAITCNIYFKIKNPKTRLFAFFLIILGSISCFMLLLLYVTTLETNTAAGNHFLSLLSGLRDSNIFGNGLGTAGYNAIIAGGDINNEYTESFFAVLSIQIGYIGMFLFYFFLFLKAKKLINLYYVTNNSLVLATVIIFIGIIIESLISGSSVTMLGTSIFFIIPGVIERNKNLFLNRI